MVIQPNEPYFNIAHILHYKLENAIICDVFHFFSFRRDCVVCTPPVEEIGNILFFSKLYVPFETINNKIMKEAAHPTQ